VLPRDIHSLPTQNRKKKRDRGEVKKEKNQKEDCDQSKSQHRQEETALKEKRCGKRLLKGSLPLKSNKEKKVN